jgi:hypothetical protein
LRLKDRNELTPVGKQLVELGLWVGADGRKDISQIGEGVNVEPLAGGKKAGELATVCRPPSARVF